VTAPHAGSVPNAAALLSVLGCGLFLAYLAARTALAENELNVLERPSPM
jgi:hypothetical protein